jgi:hypothetical protein
VFLGGVTPLPRCFWQCEFGGYSTVAGAFSQRHEGVCDDCCHAYFVAHDEVIFDDPDYDKMRPCEHWRWCWDKSSEPAMWVLDHGRIALRHDDFGVDGVFGATGHVAAGLRDRIEALWADACNDVRWRGRDV